MLSSYSLFSLLALLRSQWKAASLAHGCRGLLTASLLAASMMTSGCLIQSEVQGRYVEDQSECRNGAEQNIGRYDTQNMNPKDRNSQLVTLFSDCMAKNGWQVARPKRRPTTNGPHGPLDPYGSTATAARGTTTTTTTTTTQQPQTAQQQQINAQQQQQLMQRQQQLEQQQQQLRQEQIKLQNQQPAQAKAAPAAEPAPAAQQSDAVQQRQQELIRQQQELQRQQMELQQRMQQMQNQPAQQAAPAAQPSGTVQQQQQDLIRQQQELQRQQMQLQQNYYQRPATQAPVGQQPVRTTTSTLSPSGSMPPLSTPVDNGPARYQPGRPYYTPNTTTPYGTGAGRNF